MVVPELDDAFPEDQGSGDFELEGLSPPPGGDGYSDGYRGGYAEKKTEEVINPFPFPAPTFAYTEYGNSLETSGVGGSSDGGGGSSFTSNKNKFGTPYQNSNSKRTTSWSASANKMASNEKTFGSSDFVSTSSTVDSVVGNNDEDTLNTPAMTENAADTRQISNSDSESYSNNDTGMRTNGNMVNAEEELSAPPKQQQQEQDIPWQQDLEEAPLTPIIDEVDQAAFAPFSSVSAPIKPLVAPLKLSSKSATMAATTTAPAAAAIAVPSIEGNAFDDLVVSLQGELKSVEREIETMAPPRDGAKPVNLNSTKQVSQLLFGQPDMSTNKSTLEGMAGSNILAKLVLEYRDIKRRLNRVLKQQELRNASNNNEADANNNNHQDSSNLEASPPPRAMKDPVLLLDTSSFIFRAYYSTPPIHRGSDGMPIGAVMGFCSMLNKLMLTSMLKGETPLLVHCLDAPGKTFRKDMYPDYKAHRPPCPLDLVPQFDLINKAARAYGMIQIQAVGFEADDVIATLATIGSQQEGLDVKILSGDKDLMQLVTEDDDDNDDTNHHEGSTGMVHMVDPMTSKVWTHEKVVEKWGVTSSQLGDVLALAGDAADNIPGVPGIGPKIAAQLMQEFGTLESLLENTDKIPQAKRREKLETNVDSARISRKLVELERGLEWSQMEVFHPTPLENTEGYDASSGSTPTPLSESTKIGDLRMQPIQVDRILAFYDDMGFRKLKTQLTERLARAQTNDATSGESPSESFSKSKPSLKPMAAVAPIKSPKPTAAAARSEKPKPKTIFKKRNFWEKFTREVPKPEEYEDVPF